jgi:L-asparaginase II
MDAVPLVRVVRSDVGESLHLGDVAVCDADGRLVASAGDPSRFLFARSCMKPLQAAVVLRAVGAPTVDERELAVMCASHEGEMVHVRTVRRLLRGARLTTDALQTPATYPSDPDAHARARARAPIYHNCSGKHAGMLLASVRSGWDRGAYRRGSHPLQRRVTEAVVAGTGVRDLTVGVDGCGLPVHGMPLRVLATLFARLARPERLDDLEPFARRATEAMLAHPYLVGGNGRLDTAIMTASGDVVAKEGAESLTCAVSLSSGLGVAVKIADGGYRAAGPALLHVLEGIDALTRAQLEELADHARPVVLGGGRPVGEMTPVFDLRRRR